MTRDLQETSTSLRNSHWVETSLEFYFFLNSFSDRNWNTLLVEGLYFQVWKSLFSKDESKIPCFVPSSLSFFLKSIDTLLKLKEEMFLLQEENDRQGMKKGGKNWVRKREREERREERKEKREERGGKKKWQTTKWLKTTSVFHVLSLTLWVLPSNYNHFLVNFVQEEEDLRNVFFEDQKCNRFQVLFPTKCSSIRRTKTKNVLRVKCKIRKDSSRHDMNIPYEEDTKCQKT